jgi:hypothetical protein
MFVMQACYGAPYRDQDMPDPMEMNDEAMEPEVPVSDTLAQADLHSAE